jgi:hypothetical protein
VSGRNRSGHECPGGSAVVDGFVRILTGIVAERAHIMRLAMRRMKPACAAIVLISMSSGAMAQAGPLTTGMTCNQARNLVASQGAVVLNTGATTYDRYVASGAYCGLGEVPVPGLAPTKDASRCLVGSRCVPVSRGSGP